MTEMFGEAWSPMSVPDLAPDDDDDDMREWQIGKIINIHRVFYFRFFVISGSYYQVVNERASKFVSDFFFVLYRALLCCL